MQYKHLSVEERETIQELLWKKRSVRAIAQQLSRSPSSITREILRNIPPVQRRYTPRLAHERALVKRQCRGRIGRLKTEAVRQYVIDHLKLGWSPEQIAATCRNGTGIAISHEAIYQFIYASVTQGGQGPIQRGVEDLRPYLPRRHQRRAQQGMRRSYRIDQGPLPSIADRPVAVDARIIPGHWEDDLVISRASSEQLKTMNERVSGVVFIGRVYNGTADETNRVVSERLCALPPHCRRTLTRDRGSENLGYDELEHLLDIRCYFAHAYHSWERGSNENTNGLIRRFFPKKTDFSLVTDAEIQRVEYLLNSRPRKRLGWKTPYEVFYQLTGVALQC